MHTTLHLHRVLPYSYSYLPIFSSGTTACFNSVLSLNSSVVFLPSAKGGTAQTTFCVHDYSHQLFDVVLFFFPPADLCLP